MRKVKNLVAVAMTLLLCTSLFAQKKITVSGSVLDAVTGEPVSGYVQLLGSETKVYAAIDFDGHYSISVPSNGTLVVEALGYKREEVAVNNKTAIDILLSVDSEMLEGTMVVGYGSAKKIGNLVGSITTVKSDVVKNAPAASALDMLQGQVAGMQVLSTGGVAGDNSISMKIHGRGSLESSSEPLFIIDGIPSSSTSVMSMNPNDILSVTVLKDASATSIYGAQGANGVVYVTTKSGQYDQKATITVTSQYGTSTLANEQFYYNMMSGPELKEFWMRSGLMTADQINTTYTSKGFDADTKWYKYFQRFNTPQYQNDVTIEGGSKTVAYMVGASQFHQEGTTVGNFYDRYTVRTNLQGRPKDWMKFGINVAGSINHDRSNPNWGDSGNTANYTSGGLSFLINPLYPAVDENGKEYEVTYPNGHYNPEYYMKSRQDDYMRYAINGSAFVEFEPFKNFKLTSRAGTDSYLNHRDAYLMPSSVLAAGSGQRIMGDYLMSKNTITNTAEYSFNVNHNHDVSLLVGHEGISYDYSSFSGSSSGQNDDRLINLQNGKQENYSVNNSLSQYRFLSFFGHADYSYQDKYIVDFTLRNDASSRFGSKKRNATFWASGAMWNISREPFMREAGRFVNDLKFKVSYGTQGNAAIGNYEHLGLIGAGSKYNDVQSLVVSQPSNDNLTWEQQSLATVALTGKVLGKLDFDFTLYDRRTTEMLMDVPFPYTSGFTSVRSNVGSLQNRGIDITLGYDILKGRDYSLTASATFNFNQEKILSLFQGYQSWIIANTMVAYVVDSPVMYYCPIYAGLSEDGLPQWYLPAKDEEGNVLTDQCHMDPSQVTTTYDEDALTQNTGIQRNEPMSGGFGFRGYWKGFSINTDFAFFLGKHLINNDAFFYANPNVFPGDNQMKDVTDFWTPYNKNAKYPDWSKGAQMEFDTHLIEDASFLRLKSLQFGYNLPQSLLKHQNAFSSVMFTLTCRNLFTLTNYSGIDPEVDSNLTVGIPGNTKQVLCGLELKF